MLQGDIGKHTQGGLAEPYHKFVAGTMKLSVTVSISVCITALVIVVALPLTVEVIVVRPVPIYLVRVRVGALGSEIQLLRLLRHWHCKAEFVERPSYCCTTTGGKMAVPQFVIVGGCDCVGAG